MVVELSDLVKLYNRVETLEKKQADLELYIKELEERILQFEDKKRCDTRKCNEHRRSSVLLLF